MNFKTFIGVDVSKLTLDFCLINVQGQPCFYHCINDYSSIVALLKEINTEHHFDTAELLLCAEHTGYYTKILQQVCLDNDYQLWVESAAQIKNSQGIQRGKNDKLDAQRIALYAKRFADRAVVLQASKAVYEQLSYLCAERDLLLTDAAKYKTQLKEERLFIDPLLFKAKKKRIQRLVSELEKAIKAIDEQISNLIETDPISKQQYKLLTSIDGIGKQVAVHTMVATKGFTTFTDPRKFACHAGVAPFKYVSGTSVRSGSRVSHRANKKLKKLLHMAAISVIRMKNELSEYYQRKVAEGKNKMSVINAVRGKLIARMFAIICKETPYQKNYQNALIKP